MSQEPRERVSQVKRRRPFLKGALIVLGASSILQPAGAVFGSAAQDAPKKEEPAAHQMAKKPAGPIHKTPVVSADSKKKGANGSNVKNTAPKAHTAKRSTAKRS